MCPFKRDHCGNSTAFVFDSVGQQQNISISLPQGETCSFQITADCGLPSFKPNDTTGFEIETIDYDDDDLVEANSTNTLRRLDDNEDDDDDDNEKGSGKRPKTSKKNERDESQEKHEDNERHEYGSDRKGPKPPKQMKVKEEREMKNDGPKNHEKNKTKGALKSRYNPEEG